MYLRKNLIHILCFLEIKELNNEDDMGQLKYFITYYNIIANKILKVKHNTHLTWLYTVQRAAGATTPPPPHRQENLTNFIMRL